MLISNQKKVQTDVIQKILGGDSNIMDIVKELEIEEELTDEQIAAKIGIRLNEIRRILYQLYETRLADCRRIRDKKTGWYVFYWHMRPDKISNAIVRKRRKVLNILEERLDYEKNNTFFHCNNVNCSRITWENAMESRFRCLNCNEQLKSANNDHITDFLEKQIESLKNTL